MTPHKPGDLVHQYVGMNVHSFLSLSVPSDSGTIVLVHPGVDCRLTQVELYSDPALSCNWLVRVRLVASDVDLGEVASGITGPFYVWTLPIAANVPADHALHITAQNLSPSPQDLKGAVRYASRMNTGERLYYAPCGHEECERVQGMAADCWAARCRNPATNEDGKEG